MQNYHQQNYMQQPGMNPNMVPRVNMPYGGPSSVGASNMIYSADSPMMTDEKILMHQNSQCDEAPAKLKKLDEINTMILKLSQNLISLFDELLKEKLTVARTKTAINECIDCLKQIETDLICEINYLGLASTGHPHEGSIYGAKKDYDLAKQRLLLVTQQINCLRQTLDSPLPIANDQ
jgi:hypothetical protein